MAPSISRRVSRTFAAPEILKKAAADAIFADVNQYAITWGAKKFRNAMAEKTKRYLGIDIDPEREITVCCGSTEGMLDVLMAVINPGDEVIVFEPFYENYGPDAIISGATPRYVQLRAPDWSFDEEELAAAFNNNTKAIIINTPNNPTGKVFSRAGTRDIAAALHEVGRSGDYGRDLRTHSLRRRQAHFADHSRWHARADDRRQRNVQDL